MRSPITALLWEIWHQHRWTVAVIAGLTLAVRLLASEPDPLVDLSGMLAFLLLFGVFNYTDAGGGRALGRFPRRLFTLPVSSLRLVAVPMLAAIAAVELLHLLWIEPMSRGEATSGSFVAVLLASFVVFYLAALWTLERTGALRLIVLGVLASGLFVISLLPSFPPTPPPPWRSELVLSGLVAASALVAFLLAWRHVARLRAGDSRNAHPLESLTTWMANARGARQTAFKTAAAAHFWFEWKCSGFLLPTIVAGVVLFAILPMSVRVQGDPDGTFLLLLVALTAPIAMAIPAGIATAKPTVWSEELALPPFVAVRPLSSEDIVASKLKVAAVSAALSWLMVLVFLAAWLPGWANLDSISRFALQLWAFHGHSSAAVYAIAVLIPIAGMFLTWRFLISRLWSGLSGSRPMFVTSVVSIVMLAIAGFVFVVDQWRWLLDDPGRLAPVVWIAAVTVIAKYWLAAYAWRGVGRRYLRVYLLIWLAGTASLLALGVVTWGVVRIYVPLDVDRWRSLVILLALLAVPIARVGLAPSLLARNRHRA